MQVFRAAVRTATLALAAMLTALAAILAAAQSPSPNDTPYLTLLGLYAADPATAVATLSTWPERRVDDAVRALDKQTARDRARAAIMLHTEAALAEPADGREPFHIGVARFFVGRLDRSERDFVARWHALVAALYCVRRDSRRARLEVNQGLALDGKHPDVNLVAGAVIEYEIASEEPNLRGAWNVSKERDDILHKQLHRAAQIYRVVLSSHPDFLEARLRLGWVLTLNDSLPAAREQLEMVAAQATNTDLSYLAHMFLAALHERSDHPAEAGREYELAWQVAPYQSSLVGLIRATAAAGEVDRARELAEHIPRVAASGEDDPWNSYTSCFTGDELFAGLRTASRVP